jgi:hypothetical protein
MVDIRTQLKGAGLPLSDQTFYSYFVNSLPCSCALFVTLYDDTTYNVERLCDRFTAYEMRCKLADMTDGMAGSSSGSALALSSQQTSSKGKGKERQRQRKDRDLTDVTCCSCGGKGHLCRNCPTVQKEDGKSEAKPADQQDQKRPDEKQKGGAKSAKDDAAKDKAPLGMLYMATLADALEPFYMDSAASYHLVPLGNVFTTIKNSQNPWRSHQLAGPNKHDSCSDSCSHGYSARGTECTKVSDVCLLPVEQFKRSMSAQCLHGGPIVDICCCGESLCP